VKSKKNIRMQIVLEREKVMKDQLNALLTDEVRECELCGSRSWRILHEGDESNCECEGECLRVCDNPELDDEGCDGVAELVKEGESNE